MVGHEEGVEPAALQRLRERDKAFEVEISVRRAAGIAPPGGVNADRAHEGAQMQPAFLSHAF